MCALSMAYFYVVCTVRVTIFSIGGKFRPVYVVTRSYSSCPFLCALDVSENPPCADYCQPWN